ncbi:MAG: hypothetical protein ACRCXT_18045 [Paraclostridium sp.]
MRNIIFIFTTLIFLTSCKEGKTSENVSKNTQIVNSTKEVDITTSLFNENTLKELKNLQNWLNTLYTYSTELKYDFEYDDIAFGISKENSLWFRTNSKNTISSYIDIDLNTLSPSIHLQNDYGQIKLKYSDFLKIIEKVEELNDSLFGFNGSRVMQVILFDNTSINSSLGKVILEITDDYKNIIFINKKDNIVYSRFEISNFLTLKDDNRLEVINNIITNYSPKLLENIIDLSQFYKKLDTAMKITKKFETENKNPVDTNWVENSETYVNYYSNGRIKSVEFLDGEYEFENQSYISLLKERITTLQEESKSITPDEFDYEFYFETALFYNIEASNLNISKADKETLDQLKEKLKALSKNIF